MKTRHITFALALLAAGLAFAPASAGASSARIASGGDNCTIEIVGQNDDGEFETAEPVCYDTFADSLKALGAPSSLPDDLTVPQAVKSGTMAALASFVLGTHYDGANLTGASINVVGGNCGGGYINLSASWQNRISSTANGCPVVRHFDGFSLTGSSQYTLYGAPNLTVLNNLANSIQYSTS